MTTFLDREARTQAPAALSGNLALNGSIERLPSGINDGSVVEQRFNLAIDVMIAAAERAKITPAEENLYIKSNDHGQRITFGRQLDKTDQGETVIRRLLCVRDPLSSACIDYTDKASSDGQADFTVHREMLGVSMSAEFSGTEGQPLTGADIAISQHFAEIVLDFAEKDPDINTGLIKDIVSPITDLEATRRSIVDRFLAKFNLGHAAA